MNIIKEKGLTRHLGERVFVGNKAASIFDIIFDLNSDSDAKLGILCEDDLGFYIQVCRRPFTASRVAKVTDEIYRIKNKYVLAIISETSLNFYEINLS